MSTHKGKIVPIYGEENRLRIAIKKQCIITYVKYSSTTNVTTDSIIMTYLLNYNVSIFINTKPDHTHYAIGAFAVTVLSTTKYISHTLVIGAP